TSNCGSARLPPLLLLQDIHLTFGGTPLRDGAELSDRRGRAPVPCRPQWLGQVDAPEDRRRHGRLRYRDTLPAALGHRPLPAAETDVSGFATTAAFVEAGLGPS